MTARPGSGSAAGSPDRAIDARAALVTRPLAAPPGLTGPEGRRYELFGPVLHACLRDAVEGAAGKLFDDADLARADDRRRLSFAAARSLAALRPTLQHRIEDALLQLFTDADGLGRRWNGDVGAFTLEQLADRLVRRHGDELVALSRRFHGRHATSETGGAGIAAQLAGLLAIVADAERLPAHARNVVCAEYARRLETVLPGLAGLAGTVPAESALPAPRPPLLAPDALIATRALPRPVIEALRHAQLVALDGTAPEHLAEDCRGAVARTRARVDADETGALLDEIAEEVTRLERRAAVPDLPAPLADALRRLQPVLLRSHLQHGRDNPRTRTLLHGLVQHLADLVATDDDDPRHAVLDDLCGDLLARYVGDEAGLAELVEEILERLESAQRTLAELRRRARDRALIERRRSAAGRACERVCARLILRVELQDFVLRVWRPALSQAHLRYGPLSAPWRRMLELGQDLLTADRAALSSMRGALADALSLAHADATEIERQLDELARRIEDGGDATILPQGVPEAPAERDLSPLPDHHGWLLENGRRRWVMVQPEDGQGQVLLTDPRARRLEWVSAAWLRGQIEDGSARPLTTRRLLPEDRDGR